MATPSALQDVAQEPPGQQAGDAFTCLRRVCRLTTFDGLRVAWTDDYEALGRLCDTADVVVVARAVRVERCRSGAVLATLRTLRRTGTLSVSRSDAGIPQAVASVDAEALEWNRHRLAPWPERWERPTDLATPETASTEPGIAGASGTSAGAALPADPRTMAE